MIVVSDTSPIINLAMISRLDLLPALFGKVVIPQQVFEEITVQGHGMPGADDVRSADWVEVRTSLNISLVQALRLQVDSGEAEAIVLAMELKSDLLLIDERIGRQVAKSFELPIMGLLGVLKLAKERGLILTMKPILDQLIQQAGFRIAPELYQAVLEIEGE